VPLLTFITVPPEFVINLFSNLAVSIRMNIVSWPLFASFINESRASITICHYKERHTQSEQYASAAVIAIALWDDVCASKRVGLMCTLKRRILRFFWLETRGFELILIALCLLLLR
jgi:hypothetical protein